MLPNHIDGSSFHSPDLTFHVTLHDIAFHAPFNTVTLDTPTLPRTQFIRLTVDFICRALCF